MSYFTAVKLLRKTQAELLARDGTPLWNAFWVIMSCQHAKFEDRKGVWTIKVSTGWHQHHIGAALGYRYANTVGHVVSMLWSRVLHIVVIWSPCRGHVAKFGLCTYYVPYVVTAM